MIGTLAKFRVFRTSISVFGFAEVVVEVAAVVVKAEVVIGQVYSGQGHPFGQPDWHGHRFKFSFWRLSLMTLIFV